MNVYRFQWNTGRQYDEHGQRIVAQLNDRELLFSDLSRHINGAIPLGDYLRGYSMDTYAIHKLVMANYDYGNYSGSGTTLTWIEEK